MRARFVPALLAVLLPHPLLAADRSAIPACAPGVPVKLNYTPPAHKRLHNNRAELSGVVLKKDLLLILSNEGLDKDERVYSIQVFKGSPDTGYNAQPDVELFKAPKGACKAADFEGLTRSGNAYFAITSHSLDRKKPDEDEEYATNRRNLTREGIEACDTRHQLIKFRIGAGGAVEAPKRASLRDLIERHPVLGPFARIPSKENGVDIEGIAALGNDLYVGFRGPVLRQNYVPVLKLSQTITREAVKRSKTLFVDLGGRGIRDIAPGKGGKNLVILAGPNGDEVQSFVIYFWDGRDQLVGKGHNASLPDPRCDLGIQGDDPQKSKPEGIAYVDTVAAGMRFLLVYDGKAPLKAELRTVP
jgi:hypothetical protein